MNKLTNAEVDKQLKKGNLFAAMYVQRSDADWDLEIAVSLENSTMILMIRQAEEIVRSQWCDKIRFEFSTECDFITVLEDYMIDDR